MTQENRRAMNFAKDAEPETNNVPITEMLRITRTRVEQTADAITQIAMILSGQIPEAEEKEKEPESISDDLRLIIARCERINLLANKALNALIG